MNKPVKKVMVLTACSARCNHFQSDIRRYACSLQGRDIPMTLFPEDAMFPEWCPLGDFKSEEEIFDEIVGAVFSRPKEVQNRINTAREKFRRAGRVSTKDATPEYKTTREEHKGRMCLVTHANNDQENLCTSCKSCIASCKAGFLVWGKKHPSNDNIIGCDTYEQKE